MRQHVETGADVTIAVSGIAGSFAETIELLQSAREAGLAMLYLGPGSGDDVKFTMALARAATRERDPQVHDEIRLSLSETAA